MRTRKKTQRLWNLQGTNDNTFTNDGQEEQILFSLSDEDFSGGAVRLHRIMGLVNVYVENYVAGATSFHLWHGALMVDGEALEGVQTNLLSQSDDNAIWLWREPISLFPCGKPASTDDWHLTHKFDWPIRGGKGSTIQAGYDFRYVVSVAINGNASIVKTNTLLLNLFSSN